MIEANHPTPETNPRKPWAIGTRLRYWSHGLAPWRSCEVLGYTPKDMVRVKFITTGRISNVRSSSLSVI